MPQLKSLVPVAAMFPDLSLSWNDFSRILRRLSRTDTVMHIGRIGALVSKNGRGTWLDMQRRAFAFVGAPKERGARLDDLVRRHPNQSFHPISRGMLLELLRWVALVSQDQPRDEETFESPSACDDLLAALLMAGEIWARRVYARYDPKEPPSSASAAIRLAVQRSSYLENNPIDEAPHLFARGLSILGKFLPERCPEFPSWFEQATELPLDKHLMFSHVMYQMYVESTQLQPDGMNNNIGLFQVAELGDHFIDPKDRELIQHFVRRSSLPIDSLKTELWRKGPPSSGQGAIRSPPAYDLSVLRERPIVVARSGRAVIIDPAFFGEFCLSSPVFMLRPEHRPRALGCYGNAFEDYCLSILERIFPSGVGVVRPLGKNVDVVPSIGRSSGEFDALLRHGDAALCFEAKHAFLPETELSENREQNFLATLLERYAKKPKGTYQLAEALKRLAGTPMTSWPEMLRGTRVFLPILVVSDTRLDELGAAELLREFGNQLDLEPGVRWQPYPVLNGRNTLHIAPLAVCDVSDLEWLEQIARRRTLYDVFNDYALRQTRDRVTFSTFLSSHPEYGRMFRISEHSLAQVDAALLAARDVLFGREAEPL